MFTLFYFIQVTPLFQGVSCDLLTNLQSSFSFAFPIAWPEALLFSHPVGSSRKLKRVGYRLRLLESLQNCVVDYMTSHLSDDVIGPISKATFLFIQQQICRYSFFRVEVARLEEPVRQLDFPSNMHCELIIASEKQSSAGIEPRSPRTKILRSEHSSTVLAGP